MTPRPTFSSSLIRRTFLEFFQGKGHTIVPSAPLVPGNDPTLLFTNSGMVQFKNVFLGSEKLPYVRAADVQRCLRAGGKHNDLDQVGYTARHHTFFEMLGNWSFGDYFKREAISWAWELLTDVFKLPADRLLVTIYHTDDEAFDLWHREIGLPPERIVRIGDNKGAPFASDNFWQMADTGPCGPCTEIFYDHGAHIAGGPPGSPDEDGDRFIEIWNLVFMQFDRASDGTLAPLPAPCVDTGMGLERLAAILQHVHSNYGIDLFQSLIKAAAKYTNTQDLENKSLRVIADHIRACSFLIVDGVLPSNEGRGYVLRRIIRRALRHGYILGQRGTFFYKLVSTLVNEMGQAYPELSRNQEIVENALKAEEERFSETLEHGMKVFDEIAARSDQMIAGSDAFRLYDTYGFPVDLTADIAREQNLGVDMVEFEIAMNAQRARARAASHFESKAMLSADVVQKLAATEFSGYEGLTGDRMRLLAILRGDSSVDAISGGDATLIFDRSPFYAESGGQVGDTGNLTAAAGKFAVRDTIKLAGSYHGHVGSWVGSELRVGDEMRGEVDFARRQSVVLNHSATHLLHAALRAVLGTHVAQKGSLVAPDRLRFDFSHFAPVGRADLQRVEDIVNTQVRHNVAADIHHMGYNEAIDFGAMALFGEKYGAEVRVLKMGEFSTELCGGTHVTRTGDIGLFKIVSESGVAAGVRRIEAVTGAAALAFVVSEEARLDKIAQLLSIGSNDIVERLQQLLTRQKKIERELETLKVKSIGSTIDTLATEAKNIQGIKLVIGRLDGLDAKGLREGVDRLKEKLADCVILLAGAIDGKVALVAGVQGAALRHLKAGDIVSQIAHKIDGKGGGKAELAQGGGIDGPGVATALAELSDWIAAKVV